MMEMRPGDFSVEDIELMIRKVARGANAEHGDILIYVANVDSTPRWILSRLGLRERAYGRGTIEFPDQNIQSQQTLQWTIGVIGSGADFETDSVKDVVVGDFVFVAAPPNFNTELVYTSVAANAGIVITISNPSMGPPKPIIDPSGSGFTTNFIALELI